MFKGFYIAKQEIFDNKNNIFGIELLFRKRPVQYAEIDSNIYSTASVLDIVINNIGIENLIPSGFIFLNVDHKFLESEILQTLSPERITFELIEDIELDRELFSRIKDLRKIGFKFSINNFDLKKHKNFLNLLDYAKIDIVNGEDISNTIKILESNDVLPIAFRIEAEEFYKIAQSLGFKLFQGFYLSKPCFISGEDFKHNKIVILKILNSVLKNEEISKIEEYLKANPDIAIKLIKFINSPFFGLRKDISSIKKALTLLGYENLSKWLSMLLFLSEDKKGLLFEKATFRGKMMEYIVSDINPEMSDKAFLTGIFSILYDYLKNNEVIENLKLDKDIKTAILNKKGLLKDILDILRYIELDRFEEANKLMEKYKITPQNFMKYELKYFEWLKKIKDELGLQ